MGTLSHKYPSTSVNSLKFQKKLPWFHTCSNTCEHNTNFAFGSCFESLFKSRNLKFSFAAPAVGAAVVAAAAAVFGVAAAAGGGSPGQG